VVRGACDKLAKKMKTMIGSLSQVIYVGRSRSTILGWNDAHCYCYC
jgi:hypothetical protein